MTDNPIYGPSKKKTRDDLSFEQRREQFREHYGFQAEEEIVPEELPLTSWDPERKSMWAEYFKRHPEARPKPREIKKLGQVAPGVDGGEYLAKLIEQIKGLAENYALFQERLAAFEHKQPHDGTSRGQTFRW